MAVARDREMHGPDRASPGPCVPRLPGRLRQPAQGRDGMVRWRRTPPEARAPGRTPNPPSPSPSPLAPNPAPARAGFESAALAHLDAAYGLARWLVRDPDLAEDVVQEAVLRGLNYASSFRGEDGRAWLMRIVRNTAYTMLAARRRGGPAEAEGGERAAEAMASHPDPADDPEAALARRQDAGRLERALAALPIELRECLVLKEFEELSYKEIARITGVPIGTVMSRLWRARQALIAMGEEERDGG